MKRLPRPKPRSATSIQRACSYLHEAIRAAHEDERTAEAFAEILAIAAAGESARRLDDEERPA